MVIVFRVSLVEYYLGYMDGLGFADYRDKSISLSAATPASLPRLVICLPSICKLQALLYEQRGSGDSWSVCLDEVGQTRAMTCSTDLLDVKSIRNIDRALTTCTQKAPHLLCMEYRMYEVSLARVEGST